jgi:hypothetical protein
MHSLLFQDIERLVTTASLLLGRGELLSLFHSYIYIPLCVMRERERDVGVIFFLCAANLWGREHKVVCTSFVSRAYTCDHVLELVIRCIYYGSKVHMVTSLPLITSLLCFCYCRATPSFTHRAKYTSEESPYRLRYSD